MTFQLYFRWSAATTIYFLTEPVQHEMNRGKLQAPWTLQNYMFVKKGLHKINKHTYF